MKTPTDEQIQGIVSELDAHQLRTAAGLSDGVAKTLLEELAEVIERGGDMGRLTEILGSVVQHKDELTGVLKAASSGAENELQRIQRMLGLYVAGVEVNTRQAESLVGVLQGKLEAPESTSEDDALHRAMFTVIERAVELSSQHDLLSSLVQVGEVADGVSALLQGLTTGQDINPETLTGLQQTLTSLDDDLAQTLNQGADTTRLEDAIGELGGVARAQGHRSALDLAVLLASLTELRLGFDSELTQQRLLDAFECAEERESLDIMVGVGRRLQLIDSELERWDNVLSLAGRIVALAERQGNAEQVVMSNLEMAMVGLHVPGGLTSAHAAATKAIDGAEHCSNPVYKARGLLTRGRILERQGDLEGAREALGAVISLAEAHPSFPRETADAALWYGRVQSRRGQPTTAQRAFHLSRTLALKFEHWRTFTGALMEGVSACLAKGAGAEARALLLEGQRQLEASGDLADVLMKSIIQELVERHGSEASSLL